MKENMRYISYVILILVIIGGIFLVKSKKANAPVDNIDNTVVEIPDNNITTPPTPPATLTPPDTDILTKEQTDLLEKLQKTIDARDFDAFANVLLEVYKAQWSGIKEFNLAESSMYVYATNTYWTKGDLANSLKVSTIVYNKVPEGWRFRYLRIITLEKYGRNAFYAGDLKIAEDYANQILQMMYRPEGANLLADVYIAKINTNIKDGNKNLAKRNYEFIWEFETSADRKATLDDLKKQIEGM